MITGLMTLKQIRTILRVFMGVMFLFSGISKLFPIEAFESVTVQQGLVSWELVPYLSRILIGMELLLGLLFLLSVKMRRFTLPGALSLLTAFTLYLLYLEVTGAGGENCGCFGELLPMSGMVSIIKNLFFIVITLYLLKVTETESKYSYAHIGAGYVAVLAFLLLAVPVKPYETISEPLQVTPPVELTSPQEHSIGMPDDSTRESVPVTNTIKDTVKKEVKKPALSEKFPPVVSVYSQLVPGVDNGISIVAFFSLDCDHCLAVATEFNRQVASLSPAVRHYLFLGSEDQIEPFFSSSGGSVSYTLLTPQKFYPHLSSAPPKVILLVNGNPVIVMEGDAVSVNTLIDKIKEINQSYSRK